jgi:hypothetical protein
VHITALPALVLVLVLLPRQLRRLQPAAALQRGRWAARPGV